MQAVVSTAAHECCMPSANCSRGKEHKVDSRKELPRQTATVHQMKHETWKYSALVFACRLLAFLRDEEDRERLEEIERLKPIGTAVGVYMEYRCKAEMGQLVKTEFGDFVVDNRCWIRTGHTITQVDTYSFDRQSIKLTRCLPYIRVTRAGSASFP